MTFQKKKKAIKRGPTGHLSFINDDYVPILREWVGKQVNNPHMTTVNLPFDGRGVYQGWI